MYSETGMLEDCQEIYSHYFKDRRHIIASQEMAREIDTMIRQISAAISQKSEEGSNTIFLEKVKTDLAFIRNGIGG